MPAIYKKNHKMLARQSKARLDELREIELNAISNFQGQIPQLESALGMLKIGDHFGWRALLVFHNKRTIRKYEDILGISIREFFPEEGPSTQRSLAMKIAAEVGNYWKIVSGDVKIKDKKTVE